MELTQEPYAQIAGGLPKQRGNVQHENLQVLNALLYVAGQGCKWRGLPAHFGKWHAVYTRMTRWSKNGVIQRVFAELQRAQIVGIKVEAVALERTIIKVHPAGTGALKKRAASQREVPRRLEHQDSSGGRACFLRAHLLLVARAGWGWSQRAGTFAGRAKAGLRLSSHHGPRR